MIRDLEDTNWEEEYILTASDKNIEELWNSLNGKLLSLREKFVPKRKLSGKPSWKEAGSSPINKSLQEAVRNKHAEHRHWMSARGNSQAESARLRYTRARNKVRKLTRQAKRNFENDIAKKSKSNPKVFWCHIRSRLKTRSGVAPLLEDENDKDSIKVLDEEKANILQKQFSSVYTLEPPGEIPKLACRTDMWIDNLYITYVMVQKEILNMNVNKSCGPDEIHPLILKKLINSINGPITVLLNRSTSQGVIPNDWKRAFVSPIYKKGQ